MPSVRQYLYRSVKNVALIISSIVALALAAISISWIFPTGIFNRALFSSLYFAKEIGTGIALLVALFFGYKAYLIRKTEKSFGREFLKMTPTIMLWLAAALYAANFIASRRGYDCQKYNYTKQLNGGVKEFYGKKYTIGICGSGINNSHFFGDSMDAVELTITNEQGDLLAKRHYKVFWDGQPGHEPLTIGKDRITYQDDDKQADHTIAMPPTTIDWIRAKVPLFN
ncbi:hypothetical protein [Ralstonia solanacearum]|uniref:hypothetical protein n=1 Tax=Ralstonia solanacearum TaxID=305 RepID=UPI0001D96E9E|nr:hypothetical protein [Ralstonia solanacearum]CBJ36052.1 membrane protein of unknown function [Ralstonia solanacearum PSI07]